MTPDKEAYRAVLVEAIAHEKAGRWTDASRAWGRAARMLEGKDALEPNTVLENRHGGVTRARCTWVSATEIVYAGRTYGSLSAAADAAAKALGLRVKDGPLFWGLRKHESPTFTVTARDEPEDEESEAA